MDEERRQTARISAIRKLRELLGHWWEGSAVPDAKTYEVIRRELCELTAEEPVWTELEREWERSFSQFVRLSKESPRFTEQYTPRGIAQMMVKLLRPEGGVVYDPCCGSGSLLMEAVRYARKCGGRQGQPVKCIGQERDASAWTLSQINAVMGKLPADMGAAPGDVLERDLHREIKADFIIANPPFNVRTWTWPGWDKDPRWQYGVPPEKNANFAFLQSSLTHLSEKGRMAMILPNSTLCGGGEAEKKIRKNLIRADLVDAILILPSGLFYSTGISVCIWLLSRDKPRKGWTFFADGRNLLSSAVQSGEGIAAESINWMVRAVEAFWNGRAQEEGLSCAQADLSEIARRDYDLLPAWYLSGAAPCERLWGERAEGEAVTELERIREEGRVLDEKIAACYRALEG